MNDVALNQEDNAKSDKILFIDDEKNVLAAIHRQLRKDFNILPALSGTEGLAAVAKYKPAVVVCDMRMPGMDGVSTLVEIEKRSPDTVRIMLTGNADQETAVEAINRGRIFRFLNKPCSEPVLRQALEEALNHHRLMVAEKVLLQQTLTGSVRAMVDILSLVAPDAFGRSSRVKQWARTMADALGLASSWELDLAAMLYPIGLVSVPPAVLEKLSAAPQQLSAAEKDIVARAPEAGRRLLMHIPRLRNVANIIALQDRGFDGSGLPERGPIGDEIPIEARILKFLKTVADLTPLDTPPSALIAKIAENGSAFDPQILNIANTCWGMNPIQAQGQVTSSRVSVTLDTILPNDLLMSEIATVSGKLLLSEGIRITAAQVERLRNIRRLEPVKEPIAVLRVA
jgi:response regulator RpfG family c-di-GMP phosphodiesterase